MGELRVREARGAGGQTLGRRGIEGGGQRCGAEWRAEEQRFYKYNITV